MKKYFSHHRPNRGFTIIELMVALSILTLLSLFSGRIYLNYTSASRDLKASNLVYEEARFLMEKIVREIRQNAIDYEQYANQNLFIPLYGGGYTDNYCAYSSFFYDSGPDGNPATFNDNESIGSRNPEIETELTTANLGLSAVKPLEDELYLINLSGDKRTIISRIQKDIDGQTIGKVAMLRMIGKDFGDDHLDSRDSYNGLLSTDIDCLPDGREGDGWIDSWLCDNDYLCKTNQPVASVSNPACEGYTHLAINDPSDANHSFRDISPNAINIVNLRFIIAPKDDPWKAYRMNETQIQPHITIQMTAEANPELVSLTNKNRVPSITLTSTITARNYDEIKSDCR